MRAGSLRWVPWLVVAVVAIPAAPLAPPPEPTAAAAVPPPWPERPDLLRALIEDDVPRGWDVRMPTAHVQGFVDAVAVDTPAHGDAPTIAVEGGPWGDAWLVRATVRAPDAHALRPPTTHLTVLVDRRLERAELREVRAALRALVDSLGPTDTMALVATQHDPVLATRTADRATLLAAVDAVGATYAVQVDDALSAALRLADEGVGARRLVVLSKGRAEQGVFAGRLAELPADTSLVVLGVGRDRDEAALAGWVGDVGTYVSTSGGSLRDVLTGTLARAPVGLPGATLYAAWAVPADRLATAELPRDLVAGAAMTRVWRVEPAGSSPDLGTVHVRWDQGAIDVPVRIEELVPLETTSGDWRRIAAAATVARALSSHRYCSDVDRLPSLEPGAVRPDHPEDAEWFRAAERTGSWCQRVGQSGTFFLSDDPGPTGW